MIADGTGSTRPPAKEEAVAMMTLEVMAQYGVSIQLVSKQFTIDK